MSEICHSTLVGNEGFLSPVKTWHLAGYTSMIFISLSKTLYVFTSDERVPALLREHQRRMFGICRFLTDTLMMNTGQKA